jgi:hypothetical protein
VCSRFAIALSLKVPVMASSDDLAMAGAPLPETVTCVVHDVQRARAECYCTVVGLWECRRSCPAFPVRERLGAPGFPPVPLLQAEPLDLEVLRQEYECSSETAGALTEPLELCSVHRMWRSISHLKMTQYLDYQCCSAGRCVPAVHGVPGPARQKTPERRRHRTPESRRRRTPERLHKSSERRLPRTTQQQKRPESAGRRRRRTPDLPAWASGRNPATIARKMRRQRQQQRRDSSWRNRSRARRDRSSYSQSRRSQPRSEPEHDCDQDAEAPTAEMDDRPEEDGSDINVEDVPPAELQDPGSLEGDFDAWNVLEPAAAEFEFEELDGDTSGLPVRPEVPWPEVRAIFYTGTAAQIQELRGLDLSVDCLGFKDPEAGSLRGHSGLLPEIRSRTRAHLEFAAKKQNLELCIERLSPKQTSFRFGVNCRAGRHRSVSFAEEVAQDFRANGARVSVVHLNAHHWPCKRGSCKVCVETF